jgi:hypothetical protein
MTEHNEPNIDELKEEERIHIPIEDEDAEGYKQRGEGAHGPDIADALRDLGRQFAETVQSAWNSQERKEFEVELREGVRRFGDEVNKVLNEAKESPAARKVKDEATEVRTKVESGEVTHKVRSGLVQGMHWLSQELERLAEQFSPPEKGVDTESADVETVAEEATDDI